MDARPNEYGDRHGARRRQTLVMVLALAVAVTGLPHGALDPWVAWRAGLWQRRRGFVAFNVVYVETAALVVAAWRLGGGSVAWPWMVVSGALPTTPDTALLRLVFIGLAALTLRHRLVVMLSERDPEPTR